jgi:hypothetical protein
MAMRADTIGSGGVLARSTPVLTFSPGVREQPESFPPPLPSRAQVTPATPLLRPLRSNLPIIPRIVRRPSLDVAGIVGPLARAAQTSSGRTVGKLLAIAIALAALGMFAGLNMRSLTEEPRELRDTRVPAMTTQAAVGRASDATASERVQARGTLAPRKEAPPSR